MNMTDNSLFYFFCKQYLDWIGFDCAVFYLPSNKV